MEDALTLWAQMKDEFSEDIIPSITGVSFIKKHNLYQSELSIKREPLLMKMHLFAKKLVEEKEFQGLTEDGDLYRPHITLAHIQMLDKLPKLPDSIFETKVPFNLSLGLANDLGQYLQILAE